MAFYTSSIKTVYLEPSIYSAKNRIEYRLDSDVVYLSNWRLINHSLVQDGVPSNQLTGFTEFIKTMEIMDGGKVIARLSDFPTTYAFSRLNNSNEHNRSNYALDYSRLGYVFSNVTSSNTTPSISSVNATTSTDGLSAYIDLKSLFSFLENSQIVPSNVFKDLKLVLTVQDDGLTNFEGINPALLAVDCLINTSVTSQLMSEYKGITWTELEEDIVQVPAILQASLANNEVRKQDIRVQTKGFDNKMVRRVFIQKSITNPALYPSYGLHCSPVMLEERLQVRKNGQNIFNGNGLDTPALIQNQLLEVFGEINKPVLTPNSLVDGDTGFLGGDEYLGFDLTGARTNELQIEYGRTVVKDIAGDLTERTGTGMQLKLVGEVLKQLTVQNGTYRITYV